MSYDQLGKQSMRYTSKRYTPRTCTKTDCIKKDCPNFTPYIKRDSIAFESCMYWANLEDDKIKKKYA